MDGSLDQGPAGVTLSERLAYYAKVVRRRWLVIALVPVVAVLASLLVSLRAQKQYDATSKVVVNPNNQVTELLNPGSSQQSGDPERDLNTEVSRITTIPIADAVQRKLHLRQNPDDLLSKLTTSLDGTTNIVNITARDPSPALAAQISNAFATEYVSARKSDARSAFRDAARQATNQLASLTPTEQVGPQGTDLRARLRQLEVEGALQTGNAQVVESATTPTSAATPKVLFAAVLAGFLGVILGGLAAAALVLLVRRV
jgi:uncharacterized protein involved in exopolysaccharide biosynthesis